MFGGMGFAAQSSDTLWVRAPFIWYNGWNASRGYESRVMVRPGRVYTDTDLNQKCATD